MKLNKIFDGTVGYRDFIPTLRGRPSQEQIDAADRKRNEIFNEKQMPFGMNLSSDSTRSQFYFCDHVGEKDLKPGACCVRGLKVLRGHVYKN